jgi:hypothetical protein
MPDGADRGVDTHVRRGCRLRWDGARARLRPRTPLAEGCVQSHLPPGFGPESGKRDLPALLVAARNPGQWIPSVSTIADVQRMRCTSATLRAHGRAVPDHERTIELNTVRAT